MPQVKRVDVDMKPGKIEAAHLTHALPVSAALPVGSVLRSALLDEGVTDTKLLERKVRAPFACPKAFEV